jgi:hypothetical protein
MKLIPCQTAHPTPFCPMLPFANDCFLAFTLTGRAGRGRRVGNSAHARGSVPGHERSSMRQRPDPAPMPAKQSFANGNPGPKGVDRNRRLFHGSWVAPSAVEQLT